MERVDVAATAARTNGGLDAREHRENWSSRFAVYSTTCDPPPQIERDAVVAMVYDTPRFAHTLKVPS
jgi:hypothetical protein